MPFSLLFILSIVCPLHFLTINLRLKLFFTINLHILIFEFLAVGAALIFTHTTVTNLPTIQSHLFFWGTLNTKKDSSVLHQMEKFISLLMSHLMNLNFLLLNQLLHISILSFLVLGFTLLKQIPHFSSNLKVVTLFLFLYMWMMF